MVAPREGSNAKPDDGTEAEGTQSIAEPQQPGTSYSSMPDVNTLEYTPNQSSPLNDIRVNNMEKAWEKRQKEAAKKRPKKP